MTKQYSEETLRGMAVEGMVYISTDSSFVQALSYDLRENAITATINDRESTYYNIPFSWFVEWVNSDSKGGYFNQYVKGKW
jgi:hypothetical protein